MTIETGEVINFEQAMQNHQPLNLSRFCVSVNYIPLQTTSESLIGNMPFHFLEANGNFIIGSDYPPYCYMFDEKGEFMGSIGSVGNAIYEYTHVLNLDIDLSKNEVYIRSFNKKINVYDLETLEYKKSFSVGKDIPASLYQMYGMKLIGDNIALLGNQIYTDNPTTFFFDKDDKLKKVDSLVGMAYNPAGNFGTSKSQAQGLFYKDTLTVISRLSDTLYGFDRDLRKFPRYLLNKGKYCLNVDKSNIDESIVLNGNKAYESNRLFVCQVIINSNDRIGFMPAKGGRTSWLVYDKLNKKSSILPYYDSVESCAFENDIDSGMPFMPKYMNEGKMYQLVDAIDFIEYAQKGNSQKMKQVAATLTEESNPVVVVATLKE